MTSYALGSFCLLGLFLVIVVGTIKFAFSGPGTWIGGSEQSSPTAHRTFSKPIPKLQVQAAIGLRQTGPRKIEQHVGIRMSQVELPTVQPSPTTQRGETDIQEIMQKVERILGLDRVSSEEKEALSAHQRSYFAHQHAAKYQLSQGNMGGFKRELKCARYELADLEEILHNHGSD